MNGIPRRVRAGAKAQSIKQNGVFRESQEFLDAYNTVSKVVG